MAVFEYLAKDSFGGKFSGTYKDVDNINQLRHELEKMGYILIKAKKESIGSSRKQKIKSSDVISFAYEFAGMYNAGLSVVRCLDTFESQIENNTFKAVISDIKQNVESGVTLKEAFENYSYIFSDFFIGMIEAGETGGKLGETLQMAAVYLEKQDQVRSKVRSAFVYPIVVCSMSLVIVSALIIFVIPVFQKLYSRLHVPLPLPTMILIGMSRAVREFWWIVVPSLLILAIGIKVLFSNPEFRKKWDVFKLNMPIFGKLNRMVAVSKFVRTFAMMAGAGITLVESIRLATNVANNSLVKQMGERIEQKLLEGNSLSPLLAEEKIFPPLIVQLATAGEEAGAIPDMLTKGVDFLDFHIERAVKSLVVKIEPILSLVMGLIVGGILLGVYLPMFDYASHLK